MRYQQEILERIEGVTRVLRFISYDEISDVDLEKLYIYIVKHNETLDHYRNTFKGIENIVTPALV